MPEVTKFGALDMQVCVPASWTDKQVNKFAEKAYPCGTEYGWHIRREGDEDLSGMLERNPCELHSDHVHIMLDA